MSKSPLAIVGLSCLFPKADDLQTYWSNIKHGVDAITPLPDRTHWKAADFFNADPKVPDQTYARRGGFISPVDFNPMEFGIAPKDLEATDTTQLLGMVAAKQALADAGYDKKPFDRQRTSVLLGVTGALELVIPLGARLGHPIWRRALKEAGVDAEVAEDVVQRIADGYVPWQENSFPGLLGNVAAGRIAARLDLGGTNCVVDAACASSFAALHLAALELQAGRSDMVITGGIDTFNDIFMYMCFSKTPALSPTGDAKPFDKDCDGTILGEGLGMVVLKRLADAERDGDKIYCVLRGIGSSSDGRGGAIYEPRSEGQVQAIERAYVDANITPDTVELIEAHGTGTKVGDTTELRSLTKVFCSAKREGSWVALGSVKSQIGHTKAAAGVAGLIKAALALERKVLPPTVKVTQPLADAAPGKSPFYVNTTKRPWLARPDHPRRAGVSAFGFGGTNFHCLLEEHSGTRESADWNGDVEILALCAEQRADLRAELAALPANLPWVEFRHRAHQSRQSFRTDAQFRLVLPLAKDASLASIRDAALAMLDKHAERTSWTLPTGVSFGSGERRGRLGALFPGQGSQYVGMFRDLACQFPEVLEALTAADRVFAQQNPEHSQQRLSDFIYPHPAFSDETRHIQEEALKATDVAQPALGAVSVAALSLAELFSINLEATSGHSYGELAALCGAGRLKPDSLHLLSNVRGRLMANRNGHCDRGSMLAVQAEEETVAELARVNDSQLVIANRNSPNQFVLAGPKLQIEYAAGEAVRRSIRARVLPVSAAFHSSLVADAREPFAAALDEIPFAMGRIPVYANSTAKAYPSDAKPTRDLLASQMVRPVDFIAQIETMHADGVTTFLELGPGHVLSDLVQAILPGNQIETIALDSSRGTRSGTFDLAVALGRLAAAGQAVNLSRWEIAPAAAPTTNGKPAFTVPVSGANVRTSKPPERRPLVRREPATIGNDVSTPASVPTGLPKASNQPVISSAPQNVSNPALAPEVATALQTAQQGMLELQKLQEQTAQLHQQFLAGQDAARRTLETLLNQRRELLGLPAGPVVDPAPQVRHEASWTAPVMPAQEASVPPMITRVEQASPAPVAAPVFPAIAGLAQAVLEVVAEKTGYPAEMLNLDMGLDTDLGIDSIKRVEIMAALRGRLPQAPEVKPEHLGTLHTLRQVVEFLSAGAPATVPAMLATVPAPPIRVEITSGQSLSVDIAAAALLQVVAEKTGYPTEMLNLDMGLDSDLGVDSIKRVEIMAALRTHLPDAPEIKPEHLGTLQTLRQVVEFLTAGTSNKPAIIPQTFQAIKPAPKTGGTAADTRGARLDRKVIRLARLDGDELRPIASFPAGSLVWLTCDGSELSKQIDDLLRKRGLKVHRATVDELLLTKGEAPAGLILLWPSVGGGDDFLKFAFRLVQLASPSLRAAGRSGAGALVSVSRFDGVFGFGALNGCGEPASGGLAGLVKTAQHEWPEVNCKAIDISPEIPVGPDVATCIVEEFHRIGPVEVGLSADARYGLTIHAEAVSAVTPARLNRSDVVIVTGGARGITAATALQLARECQPTFVLLGRSQLTEEEPAWLAVLTREADLKKALLEHRGGDTSPRTLEAKFRDVMAQREIRRHVSEIRSTGATVSYRVADVRDAARMSSVLEEVRAQFGPIRGVIHGAGVLADKRIEDKTGEQFDLVYGTKVDGLRNLLAATSVDDLKLLALFSSYTGRFGRTGQVDYAVANEVLNKIAQVESRRRPQCRVVSFNWGPWNGGMVNDALRKIFESEGVGLIDPALGADFFVREVLSAPGNAVEVLALADVAARTESHVATGATPAPHPMAASSVFHTAFEGEVSLRAVPCLASHVMNGRAVLPAALMIEWLAHGAMHGHPGMAFHGFNQFKILKGIVLEPGAAVQVQIQAATTEARDGLLVVSTQIASSHDGRRTIHGRAEIVLTETLPSAPAPKFNVVRNGHATDAVYGDGRLFHGRDFQGIEMLEECTATEIAALVKAAPAPQHWIAQPLRKGWIADPLALDGSFQMLILWSCAQRSAPSLPCAIASFRQFARSFPKTGSRITARITSSDSALTTAELQFFDRNGSLLAIAEGFECVTDAGLKAAFRQNSLTV
jgi:acyl transferase domain-containing protein/NAD(P)-dependent dehydrogenase (short-subunit alcohol dehydrogenase family)